MVQDRKVLVVDLENRSWRAEHLPEEACRAFLGGRGLGAYLLLRFCPPGVDPLDADNPLIISAGPAQGTAVPYGPKVVLTTKSPLTGAYLYSISSGLFGSHLRQAGYLALVVTGRADELLYLVVTAEDVEFRRARHLARAATHVAYERIRDEVGREEFGCVTIGPAGEDMLAYASVVSDGPAFRAFGRGGGGAVMGAKKLKGIVVAGEGRPVPLADEGEFSRASRFLLGQVREKRGWADNWRAYGTGAGTDTLSKLGILPTRNWQTGVFEGAERLSFALPSAAWTREGKACGPHCPTPCAFVATVVAGPYRDTWCRGPEYETIYAFGSNCGNDRLDVVIAAGRLCDEYGIDTMSAGIAIGFAMECFERGLIGLDETGGIPLRFGDGEAMLAMLKKILAREGLGALLSRGVREAARHIPGSERFAMHAKGLELGGYECRGSLGQAIAFAVSPRGGCHHAMGLPARVDAFRGEGTDPRGKGTLVKKLATEQVLLDCGVICGFSKPVMDLESFFVPFVAGTTGFHMDLSELERVAMRVLVLERLFNTREGLGRAADTLPRRSLEEPLPDGPARGSRVDLEPLLDDAYDALGWDREGRPTAALLQSLGLTGMWEEHLGGSG